MGFAEFIYQCVDNEKYKQVHNTNQSDDFCGYKLILGTTATISRASRQSVLC